ncbi:MAG: HD domain-containing phosphohydrolase, partial [Campylobacterota bacterium]|nr:HD domain-containing phosphohydrolase [Campylobacterota bacterium]
LKEDAKEIEYIFLTHSHIDHIVDLPFLIDLYYADQRHTLHIYALQETIDSLKKHLFNYEIYPDFSQITLLNSSNKALEFHPIEYGVSYTIDDITLTPFETNHTVKSCGYIIRKNSYSIMFSADTYINDTMWDILNKDSSITTLVTEVSFPSHMKELAHLSKHYTPEILATELLKLKRDDLVINLTHFKPNYYDILRKEIHDFDLLKNDGQILHEGFVVPYKRHYTSQKRELTTTEILDKLVQTGILLSSNQYPNLLEETILRSAMELTQADAGTLYALDKKNRQLSFKVLVNETMNIKLGDIDSRLTWKPLNLYDDDGNPNLSSVATASAVQEKLINIVDVYKAKEYSFTETKLYDKKSGYRSESMLVVPMQDHEQNVIGVLQLINKKDIMGNILTFSNNDEMFTRSLASQAAVSITKQKLILDLENLLESFLKSINMALDEKSPYTAGHVGRMVEITEMLAASINSDKGQYKDKTYTKEELKEIHISALMHDIGKIVTPEYIMDKETKLQTVFDRIVLVRMKAEVLKRNFKIELLNKKITLEKYDKKIKKIEDDVEFLTQVNQGSEFFSDENISRVHEIAKHSFEMNGAIVHLINTDELENLCVQKGTLTLQQRQEINNHAAISLRMLRMLSFPKKLSRVPEIAAGHHEKINGKGYPLGLKDDEISFEARLLAIADIFEALTASDRPYKAAKKLSEAMEIIWIMAKNNEIDREICRYFYESGLYREYAMKHLDEKYIDDVKLDFTFS